MHGVNSFDINHKLCACARALVCVCVCVNIWSSRLSDSVNKIVVFVCLFACLFVGPFYSFVLLARL